MRNVSYLTKMRFFGCILCTLPVILLGLLSYHQSSQEIQKQVNRGQMQLLGQMNSRVEETLLTINHALNQLITSNIMAEALDQPYDPADFEFYNRLRQEISNTQSFYTSLEDVVIVNFKENWMIKNSGYYRFDEYLHQPQIYGERLMPYETTWMLNPSVWFYSEEQANSPSCPYTISLVKKLPVNALAKDGLAYANLSACGISDLLRYTPQASETIMVMDERGQLIYYPDTSYIGKYATETELIPSMTLLPGSAGQFETKAGGERYAATYLKSDYNGWIYVSVIPIKYLMADTKKYAESTILVCLLIIVVFMGVTMFGSRRMYSPIHRIMTVIAERLPAQESKRRGINEFDVILDRMQALFHSNSQLELSVQQHLQQARTFFLHRMFQGTMRRRDLMEKLELFGLLRKANDWRCKAVIVLQIDTLEGTNYEKKDQDLLLFAVNNMIEELIPPDARFPPVVIEQIQVTLVGASDPDKETFVSYLNRMTESIQQTVAELLKLRISIGISLPFEDIKAASVAFHEGQEALKQRIPLGEGVIVQYATVNSGKHRLMLDYPGNVELELIDAVTLGREEAARDRLAAFMQNVYKHDLTWQEYQVSTFRLLNKLLVVMQESGIALNRLQQDGSSLYDELQRIHLAPDVEAWFWDRVVAPLLRIFRDRQNSQFRNISEQVIDMITKRFDSNLTIESCAAELHYNANYVSGVFRKETGLTFSEYLHRYRLHMSRKWLAETDMTIKEIAERLQYMSPQNFIRSFRKHENMTPGQYRDKYGQKPK